MSIRINGKIIAGTNNTPGSSQGSSYIVETYQNGTSWYRVWSDGWCEQGGFYDKGAYNTSNASVTLLKPFTNTNYNISISEYYASAANVYALLIIGKTTQNITVGKSGSNWQSLYWRACGHIA